VERTMDLMEGIFLAIIVAHKSYRSDRHRSIVRQSMKNIKEHHQQFPSAVTNHRPSINRHLHRARTPLLLSISGGLHMQNAISQHQALVYTYCSVLGAAVRALRSFLHSGTAFRVLAGHIVGKLVDGLGRSFDRAVDKRDVCCVLAHVK